MPGNLDIAAATTLLGDLFVTGDLLVLVTANGDNSALGTAALGGSYANQGLTWSAPSGGYTAPSNSIVFTLPGATILGWEIWDSTLATRKAYGLLESLFCTADATTDTIASPAHGFANGDTVTFSSPFGSITVNTVYYVINSTVDNFQVATTSGGSAVDLTTSADFFTASVGRAFIATAGDTLTLTSNVWAYLQ